MKVRRKASKIDVVVSGGGLVVTDFVMQSKLVTGGYFKLGFTISPRSR